MDALRDGLARGLARYLAPARLPDGFAAVFAETPRGAVFDLGANAAAAEALAHPLLGGAEGAVDLLLALSAGGRAPRRLGPARLAVEDEAPQDLRLATPHHRFQGNLHRGEIRQFLPGDDGPPALLHGGNLVEFTWRGRKHCLDVEDAIVAAGIEPIEGGVMLVHESRIEGRGRFSRGAAQEVARLRYTYEIRADSPAVRLTVTLTALPGVTLERVRVTAACDAMSPGGGVDYGTLVFGTRRLPSPDGENVTVQDGPVVAYGAAQDRATAHALRLLVRPLGPAPLLSVKASGPAEGRLHWLLARYAADRLGPGESLMAGEERLLLRGLEAALDAPRGAEASTAAPAPAIALALATQALLAPGARGAALREAASCALAGFDAAGAAPADLAAALMATETLHRATGEAAPGGQAGALVDALLATQRDPGVFREATGGCVADHAGALLALARHHALAPAPRVADAIRRGVGALSLATLDGPVDTLALRGEGNPPAIATADLARLLRALRAVQSVRAAGPLTLPEAEARRLGFLATTATALLQARIRPEGEALVVASGAPGSAPSLAAQVAALAAFLPPEGAVLRVAA